MSLLQKGDVVLFQGDSVTDCCRKRDWDEVKYNFQLGGGYPTIVAGSLLSSRPEDELKFLNRAISGNKITDLWQRWKEDTLNLKPDVLSILVGLNDTAHEWHFQKGVKPEFSKKLLELLLDYTLDSLPSVRLVIGQPFVFPFGTTEQKNEFHKLWIPEIEERAELCREVATEYHAVFVPYWDRFKELLSVKDMHYWSFDGVHPTVAGQQAMADLWMRKVEEA
jgi:lysophospholipase L1-like esterase